MRAPLIALVLSLASCNLDGVAKVKGGVLVTGATPEIRHAKALDAGGRAALSEEVAAILAKKPDVVMTERPEQLSGMPEGFDDIRPMNSEALDALWWGDDEQAAAKALVDQNVKYLIIRRDITPSMDRGRKVISRLYHDDFREYFLLLAQDENYLVYRPLPGKVEFPPQLAAFITSRMRAMIKGENVEFPALEPPTGRRWNMVAALRPASGGRETAVGMCYRPGFGECVAELARDIEREHRRYMEWYGSPRLKDNMDDMILDIHLVTERALITADETEDLDMAWEMGIDGAILIDQEEGDAAVLPGAVSYTRSYRDADKFLRATAKQGNLRAKRPWREDHVTLEKMRTLHYMDWPGKGLFTMFRGVPPVPLPAIDLKAVEDSIVLSGEWYLRNLHPNDQPLPYADGMVTYKMWPSENRYSDEYNLVRHTLSTWNLVQAWHMDPRPEFLEGARASLDWTLSNLVYEDNEEFGRMAIIEYDNNRKLGSVVVALMGIIDLARATDDKQWHQLMVEMGNFTLFMQEDNGKFDPYYVPEDHPYHGQKNDIVPGEAALALVMLYEYTGDEKWLAPLPQYLEYYKGWWAERVVNRNEGAPWPMNTYANQTRLDLVQFGPWSVMAANAYHKATGNTEFADFGLEVARWMIENYQWSEERAPWPDYIGGYYKMEGELPAMQAFCYGEGTAAAYDLAIRHAPDQVPFFEKSSREMVRVGVLMQYDDLQIYPFSRGDEVRGGTRYTLNETKVRIDYVYHQESALYQYLMAARSDPNLPAEVREAPWRAKLEAARQEAIAKKEAEAAQ